MNPQLYAGLEVADRYQVRMARRRVHADKVDKIFHAVSEATGVTKEAMKNKGRTQIVSDARHIFCYMAWKLTELPLQVIGQNINRHHSTVIHSRDIVDGLKDVDKVFGGKLEEATEIYNSL